MQESTALYVMGWEPSALARIGALVLHGAGALLYGSSSKAIL